MDSTYTFERHSFRLPKQTTSNPESTILFVAASKQQQREYDSRYRTHDAQRTVVRTGRRGVTPQCGFTNADFEIPPAREREREMTTRYIARCVVYLGGTRMARLLTTHTRTYIISNVSIPVNACQCLFLLYNVYSRFALPTMEPRSALPQRPHRPHQR